MGVMPVLLYILKFLESNRSVYYARFWIKCYVHRKRYIWGKYYRTCNGRKGLRKGKGGTCSQNTMQSMWQLILPQIINCLQDHDDDLRRRLLGFAHLNIPTANVTIFTMKIFRENIASFVEMNTGRNPNFISFGGSIHADGMCAPAVHQSSERRHLEFAFVFVWTNDRYDHTNNTRWGVIIISCTNESASGGSPSAVLAGQLGCKGI